MHIQSLSTSEPLHTVAQKVKFNRFHAGQHKKYSKVTVQITVLILAYSLQVLVYISKVTLYFESIKIFYNHKESSNVMTGTFIWLCKEIPHTAIYC